MRNSSSCFIHLLKFALLEIPGNPLHKTNNVIFFAWEFFHMIFSPGQVYLFIHIWKVKSFLNFMRAIDFSRTITVVNSYEYFAFKKLFIHLTNFINILTFILIYQYIVYIMPERSKFLEIVHLKIIPCRNSCDIISNANCISIFCIS